MLSHANNFFCDFWLFTNILQDQIRLFVARVPIKILLYKAHGINAKLEVVMLGNNQTSA